MKDKSLEEINPVKLLICVLSFISVCMALILFLLLPQLRNYKENSLRENSQIALFEATKARLATSENKISSLRNENNKSLEQFEQNFDIKILENFLQKYFKNIKIQENQLTQTQKYLKHSFTIDAKIQNPKSFYDFIDALSGFDYLVKMDYPLNLKAAQEGIDISFVIKIYSAAF